MKKIALFLVSFLLVSSTAYAFAPAIIWIGETIATIATETIIVEGVTRGFAANDPYIKNRIKIPTKNIPAAFRKGKGFLNPFWVAFAMAAGLMLDDDGFKVSTPTSEHLWLVDNCPTLYVGNPPLSSISCGGMPGNSSTAPALESIDSYGDPVGTKYGCSFGVPYGNGPCFHVAITFTYSYNSSLNKRVKVQTVRYAFVSEQSFPVGSKLNPISDPAVAAMAAAYLASDNRPAAAFMDTAGNPIPDLLADAVVEPVPNVDSATLSDLDAYRAGLLQSTDSNADYYVSPERLEEIKKLAAQQDAANTPEGELDALNEKMKQPITQAQYEETNKKYSDAVDAVTNTLPNNDADSESIDDSFNKLDGIITDIPNASLPSPAHIQLPHYTECMTLNLTDGKGRELVFPSSSQCDKINQMKSLIGYFLAGLVAMGLIWQLLTRPHG
jgi:hypothetical protein